MNKPGHVLFTSHILHKELTPYRFWILVGNILPDVLVHTYLVGHTWRSSAKSILKKMEHLADWGEMNFVSCLYLGYILHYLEDYFTYPHNDSNISVTKHVQYERQFTDYLQKEYFEEERSEEMTDSLEISELQTYIKELHEEYMQRVPAFSNDAFYIQRAVAAVMETFTVIFDRNKKLYDAARLEALRIYPQINAMTGGTQNG